MDIREELVRKGFLERVYDPFENEWVYKLTEKGTEEAKKAIRESEEVRRALFYIVMAPALAKLYMGLYTVQDVVDAVNELRRIMRRAGAKPDRKKFAKWLRELHDLEGL